MEIKKEEPVLEEKCDSGNEDYELKFVISNDGTNYTVVRIGSCKSENIIIPSTYEGKPVLSICKNAFKECLQIVSVQIENGITRVD